MAATERIVLQLTAAEKRSIVRSAEKAGLNVSEFLRRAARHFRGLEDERELMELRDRTEKAAQESIERIDDAVAFVARSNNKIRELQAGKKQDP
jgi:hypothetical protein